MTYETRWAIASGLWSDTAIWSHAVGSPGGSSVPGDLDTAIICSGMRVIVDVDQSSFPSGLYRLTLYGDTSTSSTPASLVFCSGTNGFLKFAQTFEAAFSITAGSYSNPPRIIANNTGYWDDDTPLPFNNKATILFTDTWTYGNIAGGSFNFKLKSIRPQYNYVHIYDSGFPVVVTSGFLDATPLVLPPNGTRVGLYSTGTYPSGLYEDYGSFFIRNRTSDGYLCKLGYLNNDNTVPPIVDSGTGQLTLYTVSSSGLTTLKVFEDVTTDPCWTTASGHNYAFLINSRNDYTMTDTTLGDRQHVMITNITSSSITINKSVDSFQWPATKLWLLSRNVSILFDRITDTYNNVVYSWPNICKSTGIFSCAIADISNFTKPNYDDTQVNLFAFNTAGLTMVFDGIYANLNRFSHVCTKHGIVSGIFLNMNTVLNATNAISISNSLFSHIKTLNYAGANTTPTFESKTWSFIGDHTIIGDGEALYKVTLDCIIRNSTTIFGTPGALLDLKFGPNFHAYNIGNPGGNTPSFVSPAILSGKITGVFGTTPGLLSSKAKNLIVEGCNFGCGKVEATNTFTWASLDYISNVIFRYNIYDFKGPVFGYGYNISSQSNTQFYKYLYSDADSTMDNVYMSDNPDIRSMFLYDMIDSSGNIMRGYIKGVTSGGYITTESAPSSPPVILPYAYKLVGESSNSYVLLDIPIYIKKNTTVQIDNYIKLNSTGFNETPNISLLGTDTRYIELSKLTADDNIAWQTLTLSYTPTRDIHAILRAKASDNSKYFHWMFNIVKGLGGAGIIKHPGFTGGIRG